VIVDERRVREAEDAATIAAAAHPCRVLIVVRHAVDAAIRLDAEVQVGGRLGSTEAIVMRMYGRLSLHAESVVLPLLAPDAPVVTWWHGPPPQEIATDALGVLATRRITDCAQAEDSGLALRARANDFLIGDTDLSWTRATPWRSLLASALDGVENKAVHARVAAEPANPSAALLEGWLAGRLSVESAIDESGGPGITAATIDTEDGDGNPYQIAIERPDGRMATLTRGKEEPRPLPLARRALGDLLAEELRRMDPDPVYAEALSTATGIAIDQQPGSRVLVWRDPALSTT
jgi:glucose-6-phosphate dehydrogenase assembly protein OpcA